jgi:transposase, IS5 family
MQELQRQLDSKGLVVKEGSIQDATFITADPGAPGDRPARDNARLDGAKTEHGLRKMTSSILAISFITRSMSNLALSEQ